MGKISIGFMISYVGPYGPPNVLYNIVKFLPKEKYNIFLFVIDKKNKKEDNIRFEELGVKVIELHLSKLELFFFDIKKLEKIIKDNNIKIIHSHCLPSCILLSKIKSCKKIATIHCNIREVFKMYKGKCYGKILEVIYLYCLKKMDLVVCCSESTKKQILEYFNFEMEFVRNGVDLKRYYLEDSKIKLRKKLGLNENYKYFIGVGEFNENKKIFFMAEQFKKLNLKNCGLILLGNGDHSIENKIKDLNNKNIITPGKVNNVNEYLNAADYFVSASLYEGLPNSVLEACCAKLPLLLSDIAPHKEIISIDNKSGILFKTNNGEDFSKALKNILNKDSKEMSEASYSIVEKHLNSEMMSLEYQNYYEKILK